MVSSGLVATPSSASRAARPSSSRAASTSPAERASACSAEPRTPCTPVVPGSCGALPTLSMKYAVKVRTMPSAAPTAGAANISPLTAWSGTRWQTGAKSPQAPTVRPANRSARSKERWLGTNTSSRTRVLLPVAAMPTLCQVSSIRYAERGRANSRAWPSAPDSTRPHIRAQSE